MLKEKKKLHVDRMAGLSSCHKCTIVTDKNGSFGAELLKSVEVILKEQVHDGFSGQAIMSMCPSAIFQYT